MSSRQKHLPVIGFLGLLLITGCAQESEGETQAESPQVGTDASPLDEYLSLVLGLGHSPAEQRQIAEQRLIREEDFVAQCMYNDGFTYIPFIERNPLPDAEHLPRPNDLDWVSQWGYGVFTNLPNARTQASTRETFAENDPNSEIFTNLSEGEQSAWLDALYGDNTTAGCLSEGWELAQDESPASIFQTDEFRPLFDAWVEMSLKANYEFIEADSDWANCMAEAGFSGMESQRDAELKVHSLTMSDTTELQRTEIEIALADLNCRETVDYQSRRQQHIIEVETQFVNDHRSSLEALRDAAEQRGITWLDD